MLTADIEVLAANEAFYDAFARRDMARMENLWSKRQDLACIHPGWDAILGRHDVLSSFRAILSNPTGPSVECVNPIVHIVGDCAFVVCNEVLPDAELCATNVFVREDRAWKMIHHHAGPIAHGMEEAPRPGPRVLN